MRSSKPNHKMDIVEFNIHNREVVWRTTVHILPHLPCEHNRILLMLSQFHGKSVCRISLTYPTAMCRGVESDTLMSLNEKQFWFVYKSLTIWNRHCFIKCGKDWIVGYMADSEVIEHRMGVLWDNDEINKKGWGRTAKWLHINVKRIYLLLKFCCSLLWILHACDIGFIFAIWWVYGKYWVLL